jgi:phosphatidylglycerol:prolipoprotein diacylglycerol transferase
MIIHNLNPTIIDLGPLEIRWYGLMYVIGFLITYYYVSFQIRKKRLDMTEKQLDAFLGLLVLAMVAGARLFYAIFYNPNYFIAHPLKIFFVWEGGLSFHGSMVAMLIVAIWYLRKHKINLFKVADIFIIPLVLANAFGRFGNFVNSEIYGRVTSVPWGVVFTKVDDSVRHPTQLYAVFYNVVIFLTLLLTHKKLKPGQTFGLFFVMYAVFRFINEIFKEMTYYGPLTMGQWLTIPMLFVGLWLLFRKKV